MEEYGILRWLLSEDGKTYELLRSRVYCCDCSDCSLGCDKSMLAGCLASHYMRCAATPFGHATSQGPLALLTEAFIRYISRVLGLDGGSYVDDLIMGLKTAWHGECVGLAGGCQRCTAHLPAAAKAEETTHALLDEFHLTRSENGFAGAS